MRKQLRIALLVVATHLISQSAAETICACQPGRYLITLNLQNECENSTVLTGAPGIYDVACSTIPKSATMIPVGVSMVEVSELDQSLKTIGTTVFNDTYKSGDSFRFTSASISSRDALIKDITARPRGLQVEMSGFDSSNETVVNKWVILFNNDCSISPVLTTGQQIGWATFVSNQSSNFYLLHFIMKEFLAKSIIFLLLYRQTSLTHR